MIGVRAFVVGVVVAVISVCASPAWGAFPGRDGDLVVATGAGLELVAPGTGAARSICTSVALCGHPAQPSVSPNGRAIAFADGTSHRPVVVASDGSCLWCLLGAPLTSLTGSEPAFMPGGQAVTVAQNGLWSVRLTGGRPRRLLKARVDSAGWSSRGLVALVRGGFIWVERPGHGKVRRLARGRSPSFSPDGSRLALARDGYVWIVRVADGSERRLVRGGAPAWSPDGRQIAFIGAGGAVEIIAARGGRTHRVGSVRGTALDWQPMPASATRVCRPPARAKVLASDSDAVVFSERAVGFFGCLRALGRPRRLLQASIDPIVGVIAVRLAGRFAVLEHESGNQYGGTEDLTLYDLGSGSATPLGEIQTVTNWQPTLDKFDSVALDSSGFAAWRETSSPEPIQIPALSCPSVSLCVAGDVAGRILSSSDPAGGSAPWSFAPVLSSGLTGVRISGISCPSIALCVAVDGASVLTSTAPDGGAAAWTNSTPVENPAPLPPGGLPGELNAVSCPSVTLCVAGGGYPTLGGAATILTSTDPTGGARAWTGGAVAHGEFVQAVSCPSVSLCVAATDTGDIFTSTDPTAGASSWAQTTIDPGGFLDAVSCPSVSLCVAGGGEATPGGAATILTSTDPTGGASAWTDTTIDPGDHLTSVACASVSLCVAGDQNGKVLTATDPTGGASAWTVAAIDPPSALYSVSCPSISLCVAGGPSDNILTSTDPTGGTRAWTNTPFCQQATPCISEQLFARDDQGTRVVDTAPPGQGNSIANVLLGSDSSLLNWTHDGAQRLLQLR